jgi:hypothetical protein
MSTSREQIDVADERNDSDAACSARAAEAREQARQDMGYPPKQGWCDPGWLVRSE